MCVVSGIGDGWREGFQDRWPQINPGQPIAVQVTRAEFDALKREVAMLKELLVAAKKFDAETGQPDCEIDEKVDLIKRIAKELGVDMSGVFE